MDSSDFPMSKSPRKELQGPRPTPLKVRKESHKIKKPPLAPQQVQQQQQPTQIRPPVIIYTVSPKVIHTNPSDFMNLVQRLTGSTSSSSSGSSSVPPPPSTSSSKYHPMFTDTSGAISPAARFATIEKAISPEGKKQHIISSTDHQENFGFVEGIEMNPGVERTGFFPGILSPGPTSLPPIPPNFFSPPSDPNSISFFHDLSPNLHGNFMPSPSSFNISPYGPYLIPSPATPSIDHLFNHFFDL